MKKKTRKAPKTIALVINKCYGGFGLSDAARALYRELSGKGLGIYDEPKRSDPFLLRVVRRLGAKANGPYAELRIIRIPVGIDYDIKDYDGIEWVAEKHRTWG